MEEKNEVQQAQISQHEELEKEEVKQEEISSQFYEQYRKVIGPNLISQHQCSHQYIDRLQQMQIYDPTLSFSPDIQLKIAKVSLNFEVVVLQARWGRLMQSITIINMVKPSKIHGESQQQHNGKGRYSDIYQGVLGKENLVIKCYSFINRDEHKVILLALKEIFLMKIADLIGAGPHLPSELGYDLIIYGNCAEIVMEKCLQPKEVSSEMYDDLEGLKQSLHKMHRLNIFHMDLKPDNIMFSPQKRKWVLIDYNLSDLRKVEFGKKAKTTFRGTLIYCYSQMQDLFNLKEESRYIDLFYNDAFSLNMSMKEIMQWGKAYFMRQFLEESPSQIELIGKPLRFDFLLVEHLKILFFNRQWKEISITQKKYKLFENHFFLMEVLQFMEELPPSNELKQYYSTEIKESVKEGCDLSYINNLLSFDNYFSIYQVKENQEKKELLQQRIYKAISVKDAVAGLDLMKVDAIETILSQNPNKLELLDYCRIYLEFVSYTYNRYKVDKTKRILISDHCLKEFQKYPDLSSLTEAVNSSLSEENSIVKAFYHVLLFCHRRSETVFIAVSSASNEALKKQIKKMYFDLISNLSILEIQNISFWHSNLQTIFRNRLFDFQQRLIIFFKVKQNRIWIESKLSVKKEACRFDLSLSLMHMLSDWYQQLEKETPHEFKTIFGAMNTLSFDKFKTLLRNRSKSWSNELYFELKCEYIQRLFESSRQSTVKNFLNEIYFELGLEHRRRIYPILLRLSDFFMAHNSVKRYSYLMKKITANINQTELMFPLLAYQTYVCKKTHETWESIHINCRKRMFWHLSDRDLILHISGIESALEELMLLRMADVQNSNIDLFTLAISINQVQYMLLRFAHFYLFQFTFLKRSQKSHIPITFKCLSVCLKIMIFLSQNTMDFYVDYLQKLKELQGCLYCSRCMQQISFFIYYLQIVLIIKQEMVTKYPLLLDCLQQINDLSTSVEKQTTNWNYHRCFSNKTAVFESYSFLFLFCQLDQQLEEKHHGCLRYFLFLKEQNCFEHYFESPANSYSRVLKTMIILINKYRQTFFEFLLCLAEYMKNNSSNQIFLKIKQCFLNLCQATHLSFEQLARIIMEQAHKKRLEPQLSIFYSFLLDPSVEKRVKSQLYIQISHNIQYFEILLGQIAEAILYYIFIYDHRNDTSKSMKRKLAKLMKKVVKLNVRVGFTVLNKIKKKGKNKFRKHLLEKIQKVNFTEKYMGLEIQYFQGF